MRSDSAFAESRTVPSSQVRGCSPSSLYAFLVLPRLGSVLPYPHSGLRFHRLWRVIFPHIAVRTPILPKRDLNHRSHSAGYELDDQTLSPIDSVALISMRPPKSPQKGQVLDPCWTLELKLAGIGCPALSSLSIPAISHFRKSSRQDPTATPLINARAFVGTNPTDDSITSGLPVIRLESWNNLQKRTSGPRRARLSYGPAPTPSNRALLHLLFSFVLIVTARPHRVSRYIIRDSSTQGIPPGATASEVNAAKDARIGDFGDRLGKARVGTSTWTYLRGDAEGG